MINRRPWESSPETSNIKMLVSPERQPLMGKFLEAIPGLDYEEVWSIDAEALPAGDMPYAYLNANNLGAYRCFEGHRYCLKNRTDATFIFEDDAVPNKADWLQRIMQARILLDRYEVVSMHARSAIKAKDIKGGYAELEHRRHVRPNGNRFTGYWASGSLAYWIRAGCYRQA